MIPGRISIHIVSEFVKMFIAVLMTVFAIMFIADFLEFSPKIQFHSISPKNTVKIILFRVPAMIEPIVQFIVLLSTVFTIAKFLSKNELIIFYSSGISDWKILRLFSVTAFTIGVLFSTLYSRISTSLLKRSDILERKCKGRIDDRYFIEPKNGIWLKQLGPVAGKNTGNSEKNYSIVIRASGVFPDDLVFTDVMLIMFNDDGFLRRIDADRMQMDDGTLILQDTHRMEKGEIIPPQEEIVIFTSAQKNFTRRQIQDRYEDLKFMDSLSLGKLIKEIKSYGLSAHKFEVKRNNFILLPFIYTLMAFIGLLVSGNNPRDTKYIVRILLSVMIGIIFFLFQNTIVELSLAGKIDHMSSTWGFLLFMFLIAHMKLIDKIELQRITI
jgi:LPS export ABC transporter permease LptG